MSEESHAPGAPAEVGPIFAPIPLANMSVGADLGMSPQDMESWVEWHDAIQRETGGDFEAMRKAFYKEATRRGLSREQAQELETWYRAVGERQAGLFELESAFQRGASKRARRAGFLSAGATILTGFGTFGLPLLMKPKAVPLPP